MRITKVEEQKYNKQRYNIYIDGSFSFSASSENIIKFSIYEGKDYNEDEIGELIRNCEETTAYNYALKILSIKDYTTKEITLKLRSKNYSEQTINSVVHKLSAYNLINDSEYIEKYINYGFNIKRVGKSKIIYELERKGINTNEIDWNALDEETQYENAYNIAVKKYSTLNDKVNKKEKIARHLISKGYEYELIKKVINKVFKDGLLDD